MKSIGTLLALVATVNLVLVSHVYAEDLPCTSAEESFWLCKGDPAWSDGYLLDGARLGKLLDIEELLPTVVEQRDAFRDLVDKYKAQRDEYKVLRDSLRDLLDVSLNLQKDYQAQREDMEQELAIVEKKYLDEARHAAEMEAKYGNAWSDWEVGLFSAGIGSVAILTGVGLAALIYELK